MGCAQQPLLVFLRSESWSCRSTGETRFDQAGNPPLAEQTPNCLFVVEPIVMFRSGIVRGARTTRGRMMRMRALIVGGSMRIRNPTSIRSFSTQPLPSSSLPIKTTENLPSIPIDFDIASKIEGEESQVATIELRPGETLRAESGAMLYMTEGVEST